MIVNNILGLWAEWFRLAADERCGEECMFYCIWLCFMLVEIL